MGILHSRKNDWTETLYKAYTWNDVADEEEIVGFELFDKPYQSKYDMSKNSIFHINCLVETPSFRVERKQDHSFFC